MLVLGRMDRRVTIERLQTKLDAAGEALHDWIQIAQPWAEVTQLNGSESYASAQRFASATHRFRVRWFSGLTARDRIVFEGQTFGIVEILEVGRRVGLDILATASPAEGRDRE